MNFVVKVFRTVALVALLVTSQIQAAVINTDIIFVVDDSGSMNTERQNLIDNFDLFSTLLGNGGLDAKFGLVSYGFLPIAQQLSTPELTDVDGLKSAAANFTGVGALEPVYDSIGLALNAMTNLFEFNFRDDAVANIIVVGNEGNNGGILGYDIPFLDSLLKSSGALLNVVMDIPATDELAVLATDNGGALFGIDGLTGSEQQVSDFVTSLANAKVQETFDYCTANPSDLACSGVVPASAPSATLLLVFGLFGIQLRRRT